MLKFISEEFLLGKSFENEHLIIIIVVVFRGIPATFKGMEIYEYFRTETHLAKQFLLISGFINLEGTKINSLSSTSFKCIRVLKIESQVHINDVNELTYEKVFS